MLTTINSNIVSHFVYHVDRICRQDLYSSIITSERDYISNLTTHLRYPFGPYVNVGGVRALTLPGRLESQLGCDFIIIFKFGNHAKVLLIEAKWPRQNQINYPWDKHLSATSPNFPNWSRFTSQITRQRKWINSGVIIGELFLNNNRPQRSTSLYDNYGSNFIYHADASNYLMHSIPNNQTLWTTNDLITILPFSINLRRLVYDILRCNRGTLLQITNDVVNLRQNTTDNGVLEQNQDEENIEIPIFENEVNVSSIQSFMERVGIRYYLSIDLNTIINNLSPPAYNMP